MTPSEATQKTLDTISTSLGKMDNYLARIAYALEAMARFQDPKFQTNEQIKREQQQKAMPGMQPKP
jgi:hypothetical protein